MLLSLSLFVTAESVRRMLRRLAAAKAHVETRSAVKKELKYAVDAEAGGALGAAAATPFAFLLCWSCSACTLSRCWAVRAMPR